MDQTDKQPQQNNNDEIDLIQVFLKIWRFRRFIILFTAGVIILAIVYALLAQPQYEATVKLYKESSEDQSGRLQSLASQFGFGGAVSGGTQFSIDDLLSSRNINKRIIYKEWNTEQFDKPVNLIEFWEIEAETEEEKFVNAMERLKDRISTSINEETTLITIKVLMEDAQLAADIGNYITGIISDYVQQDRQTNTRQNLKYIEKRLDTVERELKNAEEALKRFRERNRVITESPALQMEMGRLQRKVTIKQEVYLTLQKEREMAEIDLVKETPVINVLDEAVKPEERAKPKRKLIVIVATFGGFFFSVLLVVLWYVWMYIKREMKSRGESLKLF